MNMSKRLWVSCTYAILLARLALWAGVVAKYPESLTDLAIQPD